MLLQHICLKKNVKLYSILHAFTVYCTILIQRKFYRGWLADFLSTVDKTQKKKNKTKQNKTAP